jgi:hypothetical protein
VVILGGGGGGGDGCTAEVLVVVVVVVAIDDGHVITGVDVGSSGDGRVDSDVMPTGAPASLSSPAWWLHGFDPNGSVNTGVASSGSDADDEGMGREDVMWRIDCTINFLNIHRMLNAMFKRLARKSSMKFYPM